VDDLLGGNGPNLASACSVNMLGLVAGSFSASSSISSHIPTKLPRSILFTSPRQCSVSMISL
jgi:hypothetical protein